MQLDQIGKYKIVGKIGQGAMGEVFKAHDAILNRMVAIKTINADLGADETLRKRFQREAQSAARLNHPNIITVYDYGEEHNKIYMAMELLEGIDLKQTIGQRAPLSLDEKLEIMDQIADGLAFAHAGDIVHRDLKPANIHLLANGQVKIMDFGLARLGGSEMTRTGMVMGTPHYMSPEQVRGERADSRSDIFSLGCVFYELLTYRKPFDADSMHAVLFKVMQEEPEPVTHFVPDLPNVLQDLLDRTLAKDPNQRLQNAGELRTALHMAREAIANGRGDDPLPALPTGEAPAGATAGGRAGAGPETRRPIARGDRTSTATRSRARTTTPRPAAAAPPAPVRWPLYVGGLAALALAIGGGLLVLSRMSGTPAATPPPTVAQGQVDRLAQELVGSQIELARRRLNAGDYRGAAREAERAVKLDPANAEAKDIVTRARGIIDEADRTAASARAAAAAGDSAGAARGLWELLVADPGHPAVDELAPAYEASFKPRADEARRLLADAQSAAEKAGATNLDVFREATSSAQAGEAAYKAGRFATAARKLLEARDRFARAARVVR
jgi:tRNA A-37 threonylcarbamoyl transferase component Bud32/tetratricopeptide (TPR) repeat protein